MQKLKAVLRSSSKKHSDQTEHQSEATSPRSARVDRRAASLDEQRRHQPAESYGVSAHQNGGSRPLSSAYDSHRPHNNASRPVVFDYGQPRSTEPVNDSIANDYKAYLPVLTPVHDSHDEQHMTLGGNRRLVTGESDGRHEEDVADRNSNQYRTSLDVSRRKPLPATPSMSIDQSTALSDAVKAIMMKNYVNGFAALDTKDQVNGHRTSNSTHSTVSAVPSSAARKHSIGGNITTEGRLQDSTRPRTETTAHESTQWKSAGLPLRSAREESSVGWSKRTLRGSESDDETPRTPRQNLQSRNIMHSADGHYEIEKEIEQLLDGVVDLRDTVDEDKEVQWAPTVTHEVVKPHEHEIIQHKIFREIHNYEYYHRIQPVYDIEVLPPRHWIPNPNGDGLIEISADDLSSRTGANRRWKIVHEQIEPTAEMKALWCREPKVIHHPTTMTAEGFERKETTIIHPPTIADMTGYDGLVQPVHFDHKTGERWLGEITTMHRLREEMGAVADPNLSLKELSDNLPEVLEASDVPSLSQSPSVRRRPVRELVPAPVGDMDRNNGIAVAL